MRKLAVAAIALGIVLSPVRTLAQEAPPVDSGVIDQATSAALDSGEVSLQEVEMYSGKLHADARSGASDLLGAELYSSGALLIDVEAINAAAKAAALLKAQAMLAARCSVNAPAGTLRGGSERYGAARICQESVVRAPSPQAAEAIVFMFQNLGAPYTTTMRQAPGYFDCSSYIMSAYQSAGVPVSQGGILPSSHSIAPHSGYRSYTWLKDVSAKNARPGDIYGWVPPTHIGHVALKLWGGFMIHTSRTGDVSHVQAESAYDPPAVIRRVVP